MTVEELREFFAAPCGKREALYRDLFKLMFFLIGINHADLCDLKHEDMYDGRIHYERRKTHTLYNIKVEPEAMKLLEEYKGKEWLINVHDRYKDTHDQLKHFNPMRHCLLCPKDKLWTLTRKVEFYGRLRVSFYSGSKIE